MSDEIKAKTGFNSRQIRAMLDKPQNRLEDKIASLRTINAVDKGRLHSALSALIKRDGKN